MSELPRLIDLLAKSQAFLAGKGIANARRESEWIFAETLGLSRLDLYTRFEQPLVDSDVQLLRERVARRGRREPLAHVLGRQPFCGTMLSVNADVLVPRPETEELVEAVLAAHALGPHQQASGVFRVVDIGTGSGAIAIALATARPQWQVSATDISAAALIVARANAQAHAVNIVFIQGDLMAPLAGRYDLVISNPPYIAEHERALCDPELAFEPAAALFSADHGLAHLRRLCAAAPQVVTAGGSMWLEHGFQQGAGVRAAAPTGWSATTHHDAGGHERWTVLRHEG